MGVWPVCCQRGHRGFCLSVHHIQFTAGKRAHLSLPESRALKKRHNVLDWQQQESVRVREVHTCPLLASLSQNKYDHAANCGNEKDVWIRVNSNCPPL